MSAMCGRFQSNLPKDTLARIFNADPSIDVLTPRYNAAPTQMLPVVRYDPKAKERTVDLLRWGLVPHWAKDLKIGSGLINARVETVATKPAFREAFKSRRCIVPAAGFYEWKRTTEGTKEPYNIVPRDASVFAFAGLWENWKNPENGVWVRTFSIVTGKPNSLMANLHTRMPVILDEMLWPAWLGETETTTAELIKMVADPYPSQLMTAHRVSTRVNNVRNDDMSLIEPA
jgi:putative SOS response-associated peptidase YedK